jgi:hypothetical protein
MQYIWKKLFENKYLFIFKNKIIAYKKKTVKRTTQSKNNFYPKKSSIKKIRNINWNINLKIVLKKYI